MRLSLYSATGFLIRTTTTAAIAGSVLYTIYRIAIKALTRYYSPKNLHSIRIRPAQTAVVLPTPKEIKADDIAKQVWPKAKTPAPTAPLKDHPIDRLLRIIDALKTGKREGTPSVQQYLDKLLSIPFVGSAIKKHYQTAYGKSLAGATYEEILKILDLVIEDVLQDVHATMRYSEVENLMAYAATLTTKERDSIIQCLRAIQCLQIHSGSKHHQVIYQENVAKISSKFWKDNLQRIYAVYQPPLSIAITKVWGLSGSATDAKKRILSENIKLKNMIGDLVLKRDQQDIKNNPSRFQQFSIQFTMSKSVRLKSSQPLPKTLKEATSYFEKELKDHPAKDFLIPLLAVAWIRPKDANQRLELLFNQWALTSAEKRKLKAAFRKGIETFRPALSTFAASKQNEGLDLLKLRLKSGKSHDVNTKLRATPSAHAILNDLYVLLDLYQKHRVKPIKANHITTTQSTVNPRLNGARQTRSTIAKPRSFGQSLDQLCKAAMTTVHNGAKRMLPTEIEKVSKTVKRTLNKIQRNQTDPLITGLLHTLINACNNDSLHSETSAWGLQFISRQLSDIMRPISQLVTSKVKLLAGTVLKMNLNRSSASVMRHAVTNILGTLSIHFSEKKPGKRINARIVANKLNLHPQLGLHPILKNMKGEWNQKAFETDLTEHLKDKIVNKIIPWLMPNGGLKGEIVRLMPVVANKQVAFLESLSQLLSDVCLKLLPQPHDAFLIPLMGEDAGKSFAAALKRVERTKNGRNLISFFISEMIARSVASTVKQSREQVSSFKINQLIGGIVLDVHCTSVQPKGAEKLVARRNRYQKRIVALKKQLDLPVQQLAKLEAEKKKTKSINQRIKNKKREIKLLKTEYEKKLRLEKALQRIVRQIRPHFINSLPKRQKIRFASKKEGPQHRFTQYLISELIKDKITQATSGTMASWATWLVAGEDKLVNFTNSLASTFLQLANNPFARWNIVLNLADDVVSKLTHKTRRDPLSQPLKEQAPMFLFDRIGLRTQTEWQKTLTDMIWKFAEINGGYRISGLIKAVVGLSNTASTLKGRPILLQTITGMIPKAYLTFDQGGLLETMYNKGNNLVQKELPILISGKPMKTTATQTPNGKNSLGSSTRMRRNGTPQGERK